MNWRNRFSKQQKMQQVEDLYRPYKQNGVRKQLLQKKMSLQPLADWIAAFPTTGDVYAKAAGIYQ